MHWRAPKLFVFGNMEVVLDDNGIWEYTQTDIPKPTTSDAQELA